jgi:hypothetical protein
MGDPTRTISQGGEDARAGMGLAGVGQDAPTTEDLHAASGPRDAAASAGPQDAPTQQIGVADAGDHCVNCGVPLASDQRYCVNCGERRGKPRFALADSVPESSSAPPAPPRSRRPKASTGFTLIAGIATLLLAMGVGVLIGHNSANTPPVASNAPVKIDLSGSGAAGSAAATTSTAASASAPRSHSGSASHAKSHAKSSSASTQTTKAKPSSAQSQKAGGAASKVLGGSASTASATVTQGSSCSSGQAGCQGGHFSGSFFGQ